MEAYGADEQTGSYGWQTNTLLALPLWELKSAVHLYQTVTASARGLNSITNRFRSHSDLIKICEILLSDVE